MALPRVSLQTFLKNAKSALSKGPHQNSPLTFVVGNESADLDTLCTSVLLAYLSTYTTTSKSNTLYIPISNLPRVDIPLRQELLPVLARANIKTSDLITLTDLPSINDSSKRIPPELTRWILVDHNALQGDLGKVYGSQVVGCIDHHDDDHKVPINTKEEPRIIRPSGSCASLVVEHCREAWTTLTQSSETSRDRKVRDKTKEWDCELASLALAPILIDTGNISNDKTTSTDIDSVGFLEPLIKANEGEKFSPIDYWAELREAKQSIDQLTVSEILRKDYKQWNEFDNTLGISSMVKTVSFLIKKAGGKHELFQELQKHSEERGLTMCCVMASFHDGDEYTRELLLWGLGEQGASAAKQFFQDSKKELGLESWNSGELDLDGETEWRRCWWQRKTEHSRKRVAPLMRCAIERAS